MTANDYADIFNIRGHAYHAAMTRFPEARADEFTTTVAIAGVQPGQRVADIPCGGGYLARHLPAGITLYPVDSSDVFADSFRGSSGQNLVLAPIDRIPLPDAGLDHILSIAGLHHIEDRNPFWHECARLLRPGGVLTVADVAAGSAVAHFLDHTVDRHTDTGHHGHYFTVDTGAELSAAGFRVELVERRRIGWRADDVAALADFCRLLFGLRGIDSTELATILARDIGIHTVAAGVELAWELMFFRAVRP